MFLSDNEIKKLGETAIQPFLDDRVGPVSYDLSAKEFCRLEDGKPN